MTPFVSVIVATRNRDRLLAQTLEALAGQQWPAGRGEILIADNGSTDDTRDVVRSSAERSTNLPIEYLYVETPGKSYAVNAALSRARGELLAFTDDDVVPDATWLERLTAAFEETGADFVAGRVLPRWETTAPSWMSPALYGVLAIPDNGDMRLAIRPGSQGNVIPIGANMAVRASVVERLGGLRVDLGALDGTLRTGEDHEFFLRMLAGGCTGVYEPGAVVHHWVPTRRLTRDYFRRWLYQNGQVVARLESAFPAATRALGVPRYLWRQAAADLASALRAAMMGRKRDRFAAFVRLVWFAGYLRESWFGSVVHSPAAMVSVEGR